MEVFFFFKGGFTFPSISFRGRFAIEPSYAKVENLVFGRMAFRGMNPELERMLEAERAREEEEAAARREADVDDEAMAAHFGSLRATVGRKFATKRQAGAAGAGTVGASATAEAASGSSPSSSPAPMQGVASSSSTTSSASRAGGEEGEEILRRGAELVEEMRSQHKVWTRQEGQQSRPLAGGSSAPAGRGGKRKKKFLKPPQD